MYLRHQTYTLYYRDVCILVFMYLRISCYCDACLNSSDLRVGVTQYNAAHMTSFWVNHLIVTNSKPYAVN